jgi:hypothetical protein
MFGKATMAKAWVGVGKVAMAETHEAKEGGFWWGEMLTLA